MEDYRKEELKKEYGYGNYQNKNLPKNKEMNIIKENLEKNMVMEIIKIRDYLRIKK